ncbi:twin-arginine translocation signal domain-containing protein [Nesterenkonia salmonea]|uniref:Twin-arginine translocation signal domain-containing protein n=1 Tax=Nesterenkonia salmonea TaxID=1804987 RepID=A0A5R9BN06_9MICC|nr:ABC transporter substrate-binding protein [Nesterenkonia salmonea]TLQ01530.1 twin-arginine translocation signal domain-containing protein [Nesterenkonia salmonea]
MNTLSRLSRRRFLGATSAAGAAAALHTASIGATDQRPDLDVDADDDTITIAGIHRPQSLDPGLATDAETERIIRQIYEPLVGIDQDTGSFDPLLAEEWEISDDELTYTFTLRRDVIFHDGSELTADVVVENFRRWGRLDYLYGFGNISQSTPLAFPTVFGGYYDSDECVLESVEAEDDHTVVLTLSEPVVYLLQALTLPAFGIASSEVLVDSDPGLASRTPVGTGPYQLVESESEDASRLILQAFDDYWDSMDGPAEVIVRPLPHTFDRLRELQRGQVDVYDLITADNLRSLVQSGRMILQRDPFSVLYMGFNLDHPVMSDLGIREAAARAINRPQLVDRLFLEGSRAAYQFTPAALSVHSDSAQQYSYSLSEAQELLEDSDYDDEPLDFFYPINTTRSYLPQPEAVFAAIAADLTAAGFVVRPRPVRWGDGYVDQVMGDSSRALHLLGRNGGFRSPHAFLSPLFGQRSREFNFHDEDLVDLLNEARAEADEEARAEIYRDAADLIQDQLPALPLAYPISGLALNARVADYPMSPVLNERFAEIRLTGM